MLYAAADETAAPHTPSKEAIIAHTTIKVWEELTQNGEEIIYKLKQKHAKCYTIEQL